MAAPNWKSFSVFVSSTFKDMHAERDYLNNVIFPSLEEEFEKHKIHLNKIDLRWGIDTTGIENESDREKEIIRVCMDEIQRCRPFFIGIIGDRYGWIPPEELMADLDYFKNQDPEEKKSITHHEMEFGILNNAGLFSGSMICFRSISESIIQQYNDLFTNESIHFDSEIMLEKIKTFNRFLNIYFNQTREEDEKLIRLKKELRDFFESHEELKNNIIDYTLTWNDRKNSWEGLDQWKKDLIDAILNSPEYKRLITDSAQLNWITEEQNSFEQFVEKHTRSYDTKLDAKAENTVYVKREGIDDDLITFIKEDKPPTRAFFITGESGSGKSAILANAFKVFSDSNQYPGIITLGHAAHLTPKSANLIFTMQKWVWQLLELGNVSEIEGIKEELIDNITEEKLPYGSDFETYGILRKHLNNLLAFHSKNKTIVFFIDAIDYLENTEIINHFAWLDADLPDNVKLICTTIKTDRFEPQKFHKENFYHKIEVTDFIKEAGLLVDKLLKLHNKKDSNESIKNNILNKKEDKKHAVASPLWINLCLNFLLTLNEDDFRKIEKRIETSPQKRGDIQLYNYINEAIDELSVEPGELFLQLLNKAKTIFGGEFTQSVFNYLAISRYGLREIDLKHLMLKHWEVYEGETAKKPAGWDDLQFTFLRRWFKPFLVQTGEDKMWSIGHSIIKKALCNNMSNAEKEEIHDDITKYLFRELAFKRNLSSDPLFVSESYYYVYKTKNNPMGIRSLDLYSEENVYSYSIGFVVRNLDDPNFETWFYNLLDDLLSDSKCSLSEKAELFYFYGYEVLVETVFRELFFRGEIEKMRTLIIRLKNKIEHYYPILKFDENITNLYVILKLRNTLLTWTYGTECIKTPEFNNLIINDCKNQVLDLKIRIFEHLSLIRDLKTEDNFKIFDETYDLINSLLLITGPESVTEFFQFYFEYKGNKLMELAENRNLKSELSINEIENCFLSQREYSEKMLAKSPENLELKARVARSLHNIGNFYFKFHQKSAVEMLNLFMKEYEILNDLYSFNPDNIFFKSHLANCFSDLAKVHEKLNNIQTAKDFHVKNVAVYENIEKHQKLPEEFLKNKKIASDNYVNFLNRQHA